MKGATPEERHWGIPPLGQAGSDARWWAAENSRDRRPSWNHILKWLRQMKWGVA